MAETPPEHDGQVATRAVPARRGTHPGRLIATAALCIVAVCAVGYAALGVYGADQVVHLSRTRPRVSPASIAPLWEDATFPARRDGLTLRGWWFPVASGDRAVILLHGRGQNRDDEGWHSPAIARALLARGYSVLMFDLRAHGESAGSTLGYGLPEKNDVLGAVDFVQGRGLAPGQIAVIGLSYGAAAMLLAAPEMPAVGALIADSAYAAIWPIIARQIPREQPLLALLQPGPGIELAARLIDGVDLDAVRPIDAVRRVPNRPILFIQGAADDYVPPENARQLFAASRNPASQLWLVPGATHAQGFARAPDEWIARVSAFLDAQLGPYPRR